MSILIEQSTNYTINNNIINNPIFLFHEYIDAINDLSYTKEQEITLKNNSKLFNHIFLFINSKNKIKLDIKNISLIEIENDLTFDNIFHVINEYKLNGYFAITKYNIIFDDSLYNIQKTNLSNEKFAFIQSRYDISGQEIILNNNVIKQNTLLSHTNHFRNIEFKNLFKFEINKLKSFNKLAYILFILGFKLYNCPYIIKTHKNLEYLDIDGIIDSDGPYLIVEPKDDRDESAISLSKCNDNLKKYIKNKIDNNQNFIIPRITTSIDSQAILLVDEIIKLETKEEFETKYLDIVKDYIPKLKYYSGIYCSDLESLIEYYNSYLNSINCAEIILINEPYGKKYEEVDESNEFLLNKYKDKEQIWSKCLEIYNFIKREPWTHSLKNKTILIISPFIDEIKKKETEFNNIYNGELFLNNKFKYLKSPLTLADCESKDWMNEFIDLCKEVDNLDFDVALCSCGGYTNLLLGFIYEIGKSGINIGGQLQMYFGLYGEKWLRERNDIIDFYKNKNWSRLNKKGNNKLLNELYYF